MKKAFIVGLVLALTAGMCLAAKAVPSSGSAAPAAVAAPRPLPAPAASPKAVAWTTIDSISPAASRLTAAACNGKVYRFSGNTPTGTSQPVVQEYDPAVGTWATKNALPFGIYNAPSATWRDRIVLFSGQHYIGSATHLVDSLVIYYPDGDSVQAIDGAPYRAGFASCAVIADTLYVFGGTSDYTNGLTSVYACDLNSMTWTAKASLPTAQYGAAAVAYDGKVYVFGGRNAGADQSGVLMYSPTADTAGGSPWTAKTPMAAARGGLGASLIGRYAYVFGGGWNTSLNTVERYDPIADSVGGTPWTAETAFTYGRRTMGAAALGNSAYVVGGWTGAFRACVERGVADAPVYNDAAVARIEIPQQLGNYGVVVPPYVRVVNNSPVTHHNIPVTLTIDSAGAQVYKSTAFVTLGTGAGDWAVPAAWSACTTPGIVYTLKAWVNWPLDQNAANDTMTVTSTIVDAVWSQYEPVGSAAHASQKFEAGYEDYECWIAEDFWISGPDSLWLDSIYVHGQYFNGTGPMDSVQLMLLPDSAYGYPAFSMPLWTGYHTPAAYSDSSGSLKVRFPQQVKVYGNNPGLWLTVQAHMTFATNGQWGWTNTQDPIRGSYVGWWYNPGGGFGMGSAYVPVSSAWPGTTDHSFALFGSLTPSGVSGEPVAVRTTSFALQPAYPNPARGRTTFSFSLPRASDYSLKVFNIAGQMVQSFNGKGQAGANSVNWNAQKAGAGVYFFQLNAGGQSATRKLVVVK